MKVLITGACGHIGSFLAENIHKIKNISKTILVDNLKSNRFNSLYNFEKKNNLSFFLRDLNNLNALNDFHNVDAIIHCASMTNAEKSFGKEKEMYKNNLNCLKTTMKYCINRNTKLIHLSSTSVYGKQTDLVDENCERRFLKPQSPYAKIKLIEEKLLKNIALFLGLLSAIAIIFDWYPLTMFLSFPFCLIWIYCAWLKTDPQLKWVNITFLSVYLYGITRYFLII